MSKELFHDMRERENELNWIVVMPDKMFRALPPDYRNSLISVKVAENYEYQTHKDDPNYIRLNKEVKTAKNNLETYLYNKRHKK